MRNLTVTVPDEVYRSARIRAAERGMSVSALVADYLRSLDESSVEFQRRTVLQQSVIEQITAFRAADRLRRDEVHERAVR